MKKLLLVSLVMVMLAVVLVGCGACSDEAYDVLPPYENGDVNGDTNGNGDVVDNNETADYSHLIGTWQGYAIAVTQTVVITDVTDDDVTFHFVHISSMDGSVTYSESFTETIVDGKVTVAEERIAHDGETFEWSPTLEFCEDHIYMWFDWDDELVWTLSPVEDIEL